MGTVFLAFRQGETFRRMLALKKLGSYDRTPFSEERLLTEAAYAAKIRHPNVVEVIDVGQDDDGRYVLMEFVQGLSLRELMSKLEGRIPVQVALRVALAVARGLRAAHSLCDERGDNLGLIHRDVSPGNVLVGFDGAVRLTDFGLARTARDPMTQELLRGTSGYISPEQLTFAHVDQRADVFSLGVLLYEMLSGERLYGEEDVRVAARRTIHETTSSILSRAPDLDDEVASLVDALLQKSPEKRPDSATLVRKLELAIRRTVVEDRPIRLKEFLGESVPGAIETQRRWLAEKWHSMETADVSAAPREQASTGSGNQGEGPELGAQRKPGATRRRLLLVATLALGIAVLGVAWALRSPQAEVEPEVSTEAEIRPETQPPATPFAAPVSVPTSLPARDEETPENSNAEAAGPSAREPRPERTMRARGGAARMAQTRMERVTMDCVLGWDGRCQ